MRQSLLAVLVIALAGLIIGLIAMSAQDRTLSAGSLPLGNPTGLVVSPHYEGAEIEGFVLHVDANANIFTMRVVESEHLEGIRLTDPVAVDYSFIEHVEHQLLPGHYVEAEGRYDAASATLRAREIEFYDGVYDRDHDNGDDDERSDSYGPDDDYEGAEVEGFVLHVDNNSNIFTMRVVESEHLGGIRLTDPVAVDYSFIEYVEHRLLPGHYVEAEGRYDAASATLRAREIEFYDGVYDRDHDNGDDDERSDGYGRDDDYEGAEVEGFVLHVDANANIFTMRVVESEHLGGIRLTGPVAVDYSFIEYVEHRLLPGHYVEAEGRYNSASATLRAREIEFYGGAYGRDYDDDERDDDDDDEWDDDDDDEWDD